MSSENNQETRNQTRLYRVLIHSVNFGICLINCAYEIVKFIEFGGYINESTSIPEISHILYFSTFISFFLTELIYDPVIEYKFSHHIIIIGSAIGCMVSLCALTVAMPLLPMHSAYFLVMCIFKGVILLCYFGLTIGFLLKIFYIWLFDPSETYSPAQEQHPCSFMIHPRALKNYYR